MRRRSRERDRHRTWRIILWNVAVAVCRIATRRVLDLGLFRVPERATHNAAMDSLPGLDLSLPPFDLLDDAGRRQLEARVDIGFPPRSEERRLGKKGVHTCRS